MSPMSRAQTLYRYALNSGEPLESFVLELNDDEAFQVLETLISSPDVNGEVLRADLEQAKALRNPWPVMNCFTVMGMQVVRRKATLQ